MIQTYLFPGASSQIESIASAERPAWVQNAFQSLSLSASLWIGAVAAQVGLSLDDFPEVRASCTTVIYALAPDIMIIWFMISVHPVMFHTATVVIASAPMIIFTIHSNFVFLFDQAPSCNCVRFYLRTTRYPSWLDAGVGVISFLACVANEATCWSNFACISVNLVLRAMIRSFLSISCFQVPYSNMLL